MRGGTRRCRRRLDLRGNGWFFRGDYVFWLFQYSDLIFDERLGWLRSFRDNGRVCLRRNRSGWFRTRDHRRLRARHRLWSNESRSGLWLCRCCRLACGADGRRCRFRRNSRRRCNGRPRHAGCSMRGRHSCTRRSGRLSGALRDRLQHIAGFGNVRQIDLRLELFRRRGRARAARRAGLILGKVSFNALGFVFFDRTGVRFLFRYPDLGKNFEDGLALHLEFSGQIVNSNLVLHSALFPPLCSVWLRLHSILTVQWPVAGCQWPVRNLNVMLSTGH